ncbi:Hyaluronan / mRNA binding family [Raphanus sativus]|uniref:RGG repeats nuclear RNA binding protein B-like n=1 Tax=Raphanus sativus TaxID=3726 RepID=A0A6J0NJZ0_RAPSA|nr:RGG repeats nuclear RNA binding protein B-like [Raphanus sativus]KAJ4870151.1 Hyaluronan / mRNA binding family [Raphanus sativus]
MATVNPFDLLDDDTEDLHKLVAAKPLKVEKPAPVQPGKLPTKPLPPSQAVREGKNGPGGVRGGRGRSGGFNREQRNNDGPANENGYAGGYRRSEEGDGARRGGSSVGGYRGRGGGRRGGFNSGESGDFERPRRNFDRQSGTGHGNGFKRDGAGRGNWGTNEDEIPPVTEESAAVVVEGVEKEGGEATDANKETPVEEKEPEDKEMTLEEYEKVLEEKRKALQATKIEERKVDTKAFETMQQLSNKKSNNDEVFIKLGTEKDKRPVEKEEKTKKSLSINEFLKPANGERYRGGGGYRGGREGRGGRGPREGGEGRGRGPRGGGADGGENQRAAAAPKRVAPAPKIEDAAQFPTLGK